MATVHHALYERVGCIDQFWLPQFHPFAWRISLAKHSPMTLTTVWNVKQAVGLHCI